MSIELNCRACFTLINFSTDKAFKLSDEVRTLDITLAEIFTYCSELSLEKSTMDDGIKKVHDTDQKFKELTANAFSIKLEPELIIKPEFHEILHLVDVKSEILVQDEIKTKDKPKRRYERKLRKKEDWEIPRSRRKVRKENLLKYQKNAEGLYECPDQRCPCCFNHIGQLELHLEEQHADGTPYQCDICKKSFPSMRLIRYHISQCHLPRPYTCDICGKNFVTHSAIKDHMTKIHLGKRYKPVVCKECGKYFPAVSNLNRHIKHVHPLKQVIGFRFQCTLCENFYKTKKSLNLHMETHDKREMSCEFCNKIFYRERNLNTHIKIVHLNREKTRACHICGKAFTQKKSLDRHLFIHNEDRSFKCPECPFSAKYKQTLSSHIKNIHSAEEPVNCEVCGQKVKNLTRLKQHMKLHTGPDLKCEFCDKTYKKKNSLQCHVDKIHRGKTKRHKCTICLKDLYCKRALMEHIETSHKNEIEKTGKLANDFFRELTTNAFSIKLETELIIKSELVEEFHLEAVKPEILVQEENKNTDKLSRKNVSKLRKKEDWEIPRSLRKVRKENLLKYQRNAEGLYECPDQRCPCCFQQIGKLELHLEEQHADGTPYQCDICKNSFSGMRLIRCHISQFHLPRPYSCDICKKSFLKRAAIRDHMTGKHLGKRPKAVVCKECGKYFPAESNLRNHKMNVHPLKQVIGSRFQCTLCEKFYKTKKILKQHMEIHNKREMSCEFCNKIFYRERNLKTHIKLVHLNREKSRPCHICGKAFTHKKSLDRHLFTHSEVRAFKCSECPFSAKYKLSLSSHIKYAHSTDDPVNCEVCGQKMKNLPCLKLHMKLHTGPDLKCEFCDKTYKSENSLRCHIDTIHRGKTRRHKCTICLKDLFKKRKLMEHIETDHKDELEKTGKLANDFIEQYFTINGS
uniref:CSON004477 protein n=1 Tax=Culicoides sonorensis TaxID=179676 RepID=A0A336LXH2_CULSO